MEKSEQINELAKALALAQAEISDAKESGKNPHFKSTYSTLSDVWNACRTPLTKNGISVAQLVDGKILTTLLMHSSGQYIACKMDLVAAKNDMQGLGSAITYARRYSLTAIAGVADKDDDGNAASKPQQQDNKPPPQKHIPEPANPDDIGQYVVKCGKKIAGMTLEEIGKTEVRSYKEWIERDSKAKNKPIEGDFLEFVQAANYYLAREDELPI